MRTTIEIPDHQRARLLEIAARRGLKGFSPIIQEAIERYLEERDRVDPTIPAALAVLGTLDDDEADALEETVKELRESWR